MSIPHSSKKGALFCSPKVLGKYSMCTCECVYVVVGGGGSVRFWWFVESLRL